VTNDTTDDILIYIYIYRERERDDIIKSCDLYGVCLGPEPEDVTLGDVTSPSAVAVPPGIEVKDGSKTDVFNELLAPYMFL